MSGHALSADASGSIAFVLCELEWLRHRSVCRFGDGRLSAFVGSVRVGRGELDADETHAIRSDAEDMKELLESIMYGFGSLPVDVDIRTDASVVAAVAAASLEDGIANADRALHAARWIDVLDGLRTAGRMLRQTDVYRLWDMPIVRFLAAFRGADVAMARALAAEANVLDLSFRDLRREEARRLSGVLGRTLGQAP